ncbi:MAG: zinc ribbon domain-containing protein [Dehalococcoidia bacterium]|nr:MAG: zinc ribbon domain-containing protein [Dehalococcoidia bacterium]UCG83874.1 MAG: zinc ribbon domain-containing protein [Dehalococcoidia bacterium]
MPIYEFCCNECGLKFEQLRPMSRVDEDASCPRCNNGAKRIPSVFSAFSKSSGGESAPVGGGSGCATCSSSSCHSCH